MVKFVKSKTLKSSATLKLIARGLVSATALLIISNAFSIAALGDEATKPTFEKIAGQPLRVKFADGRVAVLKHSFMPNVIFQIPFNVTENTCNEKVISACSYNVPMQLDTFFLAWEKNPDSTKINQELVDPGSPGSSGSENKLEFQVFLSSLLKVRYPNNKRLKSITSQSLSCPTFDWFEANDPANPLARRVRAISTEQTVTNSETKTSEARLASTVRKVVLSQKSATELTVDTADLDLGSLYFPLLLQGDSAWYVPKLNGEVCQFTIRPNLTQVSDQFQKLLGGSSPTAEPYIFGNNDDDQLYRLESNIDSYFSYEIERAK